MNEGKSKTDNAHAAPKHGKGAKIILTLLHLMVLAASVTMIVWISKVTLDNKSFLTDAGYMHFQFLVCILFLIDIIVEWSMSPKKWRYLCTHILFIIVSIPYLNILQWSGIELSPRIMYLIKLVPLLRAGYVLAMVSESFTRRQSLNMLWVYITWVAVTVYFAALMFFVEEHYINARVGTFWTSLYWAFMEMTTCGSDINPLTPTGKALAFILSVEGLTLFPVFTVYITNAVLRFSKKSDNNIQSQPGAPTQS